MTQTRSPYSIRNGTNLKKEEKKFEKGPFHSKCTFATVSRQYQNHQQQQAARARIQTMSIVKYVKCGISKLHY